MSNIDKLIELLNQFKTEKTNYNKNKKEEVFKDDQTKDEDELITIGENMLDRRYEEKDRINKVIDIGKEIRIVMSLMKKEINDNIELMERLKEEVKFLTQEFPI